MCACAYDWFELKLGKVKLIYNLSLIATMKNNLKLSTRSQSDDQDDIYNNYSGKKQLIYRRNIFLFFYLNSRLEMFVDLCRLSQSNKWSIFIENFSWTWMACSMFEMFRLWTISRRENDLFCCRWQNPMQIRLHTVRSNRPTSKKKKTFDLKKLSRTIIISAVQEKKKLTHFK